MYTTINNLTIKLQVEQECIDTPNDPSPEEVAVYANKFIEIELRRGDWMKRLKVMLAMLKRSRRSITMLSTNKGHTRWDHWFLSKI